ncbi:hypothetical protein DCAR_0934904 [Daucus carota subsp. sativus]|uniref:non-specific serine/threonine protein kinase n=1 Tax=Daucus carota subsp. sativus TaxID=79200 RepID=A0A175YFM9_DAUCS|nr:hypothetical protein DCAR_0934904 [Daucus carota subsp. sativus]
MECFETRRWRSVVETLSLFNVIVLFYFVYSVSAEVLHEKLVLLEFKNSVSDPSGILSSWRSDSFNYCSWYGITCSSDSRIVELKIPGGKGGNVFDAPCLSSSEFVLHGYGYKRNCSDRTGKLVGKLPRVIGKLSELRVLSLPFNELSSELPSEIWGLKNIEVLDLEGNEITGNLSGGFDNFRRLQVLNLSFNRINGEIPNSLSECRGLQVLNLANNKIEGKIPRYISNYVKLKELYLSYNLLKGSIPDKLVKNCGSLEHIDLSGNYLIGRIPRGFGKCSQLRTLLLFSNAFEGVIPPELGRLNKLEVLDVSGNSLHGRIPAMLGKNLLFLNLSSNRISGHLDVKLPVSCMIVFDISSNLMSGLIPSFNKSTCNSLPSSNLRGLLQSPRLSSARVSSFTCKTLSRNPAAFSSVSFSVIHDFSRNNFSGQIPLLPVTPERLQNDVEYAFLASGNKLTGPLHDLLGNCNEFFRMIINVSNNRLSGKLPSDIGVACKSLKVLDVSNNQVSGGIPLSIGNLSSLVKLDLSWNKLQGQVPYDLSLMKNLRYLSLAGNHLDGTIPSTFAQLTSLRCLELSSNSFSGEIPLGLLNLSNLTVLLLNNNEHELSGKIPFKLSNTRSLANCDILLDNMSGSNFLRNPSLRRATLSSNPSGDERDNSVAYPAASGSKNSSKGFSSTELVLIIPASAIVGILLCLVILFYFIRKNTPNSRAHVSVSSERKDIVVFKDMGIPLTYESIVEATANFNGNHCIGYGGFGATYRAEVAPGIIVAVKRLTVERCQGVPQFDAEVGILGSIEHLNLITLIGYHASEAEMFLIYNYLPGGNLEQYIQKRSERAINWKILHKIALNVANALAYLHDHCNPRVLHRDIKPSNVLLDDEYNAYLSDFGLSRLLGISDTHATTSVAGTYGYVAPEYALTGRLSEKTDVYSYGVMLLELISDKKALDPSFSSYGNGFTIVSWALMLLERSQEIEFFAAGLWEGAPQNHLVNTLKLALGCSAEIKATRPAMRQVVDILTRFTPAPG